MSTSQTKMPVHDCENSTFQVPQSLSRLPPFPQVAIRVLKELSSPEISARSLEQILAADVVFASSVLHCANSALFGLSCRVMTLRHGIVVLGRERLRCLILTTALRSFAAAPLRSRGFRSWWHHSLSTALLSEALAKASCTDCPESYMAGLLHDVGRLALILQLSHEDWRAFVRSAQAPSRAEMSILEIEREILGVDHCEIGVRLLHEWTMPEELIHAARYHHHPEAASNSQSALFAAAACRMSSEIGFAALQYPRLKTAADLVPLMHPQTRPMLTADPAKLHAAIEAKIRSVDGSRV